MAAEYEEERKRVVGIIYGNKIEEMGQYLQEGGNVDFVINGLTPLCFARSVEMANFLVENGANIHFRDESRGRTPLLWQALSGHDKSPEILQFLLQRDGAIIHDVDFYGENALHLSVIHAYETSLQCAEILVAADPTLVNVRNNQGQIPLHFAYQNKNVATKRIIELLRKTAAGLKVAKFVNNHAGVVRNMMWRPPNNKYSFGGPAYERLKTKYRPNSTPAPPSTPTGERKSRKRTRKSKNGKSRKSKTRRS